MRTNPEYSAGSRVLSGNCTERQIPLPGGGGELGILVRQVCGHLGISTPESAFAAQRPPPPPARARRDFGRERGGRGARRPPAVLARVTRLGGGRPRTRLRGEGGAARGPQFLPARVLRVSPPAAGPAAALRFLGDLLGLLRWPGISMGVGWRRRGSVRAPLPPPRSLFPPRWRAPGAQRAGSRRDARTLVSSLDLSWPHGEFKALIQ